MISCSSSPSCWAVQRSQGLGCRIWEEKHVGQPQPGSRGNARKRQSSRQSPPSAPQHDTTRPSKRLPFYIRLWDIGLGAGNCPRAG